jgi:hypothetical protein
VKEFSEFVQAAFPDTPALEILGHPETRKDLAKLYRKAFRTKDLNHTSLACLHGPLFNGHVSWAGPGGFGGGIANHGWLPWPPMGPPDLWRHYGPFFEDIWHHWIHMVERVGLDTTFPDYTFLAGDIDASREWGRVKARFDHYLHRVQTFQVPHHGAKTSWDAQIPADLRSALFVISAGIKNGFGHPSPEVLESLHEFAPSGNIQWVNEVNPLADYRMFAFGR